MEASRAGSPRQAFRGAAAARGAAALRPREARNAWEFLAVTAREAPEKTAVVSLGSGGETGRVLSYRGLHEQCSAAAMALATQGVGMGDKVAVMLPNSLAVMELHYAASWLGAVVVNVNTHLAIPELAYILDDSEPTVIVAAPQFAARVTGALAQAGDGVLQELEVVMWATGEDSGAFVAEGLGFPQAAYEAECRVFADRIDYHAFLRPAAWGGSLPYMQYYTSGTTGRPKAVVLQNSIVCTHAAAAAEEMGLTFSDVWGHFAPMFHLVDAFAMYSITMVGGTHVILPAFEAGLALRTIEQEGITCTNMASTMITMLVNSPALRHVDLSSLRIVSCGGSPLPPANVLTAVANLGCQFFISYGMTETCGKISMSLLSPAVRARPLPEQVQML